MEGGRGSTPRQIEVWCLLLDNWLAGLPSVLGFVCLGLFGLLCCLAFGGLSVLACFGLVSVACYGLSSLSQSLRLISYPSSPISLALRWVGFFQQKDDIEVIIGMLLRK